MTKDAPESQTAGGSGSGMPAVGGAGQQAGGGAGQQAGGGAGQQAGGGAGPGMQPLVEMPCLEGMPTAEELAATPRPQVDLELLALKVSPGIVADTSAYERVVRDVGSIKAMQPALADISHLSHSGGRQILLMVEPATYAEMESGRYSAWNCLNEVYGFEQAEYLDFGSFNAFVMLEGIYELQRVAAHYATLPGVVMAGPAGGGSDGSTICLTREGSTWHYVFDRGSGDCIGGCIEHEFHHFTSDADGSIISLGALPDDQRARYASEADCH